MSAAKVVPEATGAEALSAWRKAELQKEHDENQKMYGVLKKSMVWRLPAISGGIEYRQVSAIIYRRGEMGGYRLQVELQDRNCDSVTVAAPRSVRVRGGDDLPEPDFPEGCELADLSAAVKKALLHRIPVVYDGVKYRRIVAILYRWSTSKEYVIQAELEDCDGTILTTEPLQSAEICDAGTSAEACWINKEQEDAL